MACCQGAVRDPIRGQFYPDSPTWTTGSSTKFLTDPLEVQHPDVAERYRIATAFDPDTRSSVKGMAAIVPLSAPRESKKDEVEKELA
jgi:hypothetical protein